MSEHSEILRRIPQAYSRVIFTKSNIPYPMHTVLYLPVPSDRLGKLLGLIFQTGNVITVLDGDFPIKMALGLHHANEVELFPGLLICQPLNVIRAPVATNFYTPMIDCLGFMVTKWCFNLKKWVFEGGGMKSLAYPSPWSYTMGVWDNRDVRDPARGRPIPLLREVACSKAHRQAQRMEGAAWQLRFSTKY